MSIVTHISLTFSGTGDDTRTWGPPFCGKESVYFMTVNRNKKVQLFLAHRARKDKWDIVLNLRIHHSLIKCSQFYFFSQKHMTKRNKTWQKYLDWDCLLHLIFIHGNSTWPRGPIILLFSKAKYMCHRNVTWYVNLLYSIVL